MSSNLQQRQPTADARIDSGGSDFARLMEGYYQSDTRKKRDQLEGYLYNRADKLERLLPDNLKGQADRLIERAMLTFSGNTALQACDPASIIKCVLDAAELGFAIDGKLAHAVPRKGKACMQLDYKGLLAFGRRQKLFADAYAQIVLRSDHFAIADRNGKLTYEFSPDLTASRSQPDDWLGVYSVARHAHGWIRVDWMPRCDVEAIRQRSPASGSGPWVTDPGEMAKKTGLRRLLKTFTDDPGMARLFALEDEDDEQAEPTIEQTETAQRIGDFRKRNASYAAGADSNTPTEAPSEEPKKRKRGRPKKTEAAADPAPQAEQPKDEPPADEPQETTDGTLSAAEFNRIMTDYRSDIDAANTVRDIEQTRDTWMLQHHDRDLQEAFSAYADDCADEINAQQG